MPYDYLDYDEAHAYVERQQAKGRTVFWDQWDIISFRPNPAGYMKKDGMFYNGRWGRKQTIKVNKNGKWRVRAENVSTR